MSTHAGSGGIAVDLLALQSPMTRARGIGGYARSWAEALERHHPDVVEAYLLHGHLPPPTGIDALLRTGKVTYIEDVALHRFSLVHLLSPFDSTSPLVELAPTRLFEAGVRISATVYDLIPARSPAAELSGPGARARYQARLELVRTADRLLCLTAAVRADLVELGVDPARIRVVGAAADPVFTLPTDREEARRRVQQHFCAAGLDRPFVLCSSGSHPRKNNEALVQAFAALPPPLLERFQLVVTGDVDPPTAHHYRHLAAHAGASGAVVVTGEVERAELVALTQAAVLCCVPSLAEGFGLPIAEAIACGTPVIASDRPPFDELLPGVNRFRPEDHRAITAALAAALQDEERSSRLVVTPPTSWEEVAKRSAAALNDARSSPARWPAPTHRFSRQRPSVAIVTPLPPAASGVAGYSYALVDALVRTDKVHVAVFAEGRGPATVAPNGVPVWSSRALGKFETLAGSFDRIVYALGNSHHHLDALRWLRRRSGAVLAHDVRLSNLYRHLHGEPGLRPGGFARAIASMYPAGLPPGLGAGGELGAEDIERFGILMAREAIEAATLFFVSSDAAASLALAEAGPRLASKIRRLPFALSGGASVPSFVEEPRPAPAGVPPSVVASWGQAPPEGGVRVCHFGIVDPLKRPELLLNATALLARRDVLVCFVGPIADDVALELCGVAEQLGMLDRLLLTGPLDAEAYRSALLRADVAVQLRAASNGEASAAVGECLASGVPTVVSDLGWAAELPSDCVARLHPNADDAALGELLGRLLDDTGTRRLLAERGARYAERYSFDRTARALLDALFADA